jgi:AraC family transcriptional regulator
MSSTTLLIKNMVCNRCVLAVEDILAKELIPFQKVIISQVRLYAELTEDQKIRLVSSFENIGFELIDNRNSALIENIKLLVIRKARNELNAMENKVKLSLYIARGVNHEYTYLSSLFSAVEGRTIEKYFLDQRIEKVKELLIYGQLTLSQIAFDLDYSSVAHLSTQFKSITGLTPTYFKEIGLVKRRSLDKV